METQNIDPFVSEMMYKLKSIDLCSNTLGQISMLLSIDPPTKGRESDATVDQYNEELNSI